MPSTVRIAINATDPEASSEENIDFVVSTPSSRRERWSVYGGTPAARMFWPLSGELNVFLQIWQPQPALGASSFQIKYAGTEGWTCVIPQVGRVPLMLRMPNTDIFEIYCDPYSVEVEAIYF